MSSFLDKKEGIFNPSKRYAFTNPTEEVFTFYWDSKPIKVKPKETVNLPEHLALKATKKIVDEMMIGIEKKKLDKIRETRPEYLAPNQAGSLAVPALRKPFEDMVLRELPTSGDDLENQLGVIKMSEQIKNDIERSNEPPKPIEDIKISQNEFSELNERAAVKI